MRLRHNPSGDTITATPVVLKIQSFKNGRRAKRMLKLDVPASGEYEVLLTNPHEVVVRESSLLLARLFRGPIPPEAVGLLIV